MNSITLESVVSQKKDITAPEIDGQIVMMGSESGRYYGLNPAAKRIWEMIKEPITVSKICENIMIICDVEKEICEKDTLDLINKMSSEGILKID